MTRRLAIALMVAVALAGCGAGSNELAAEPYEGPKGSPRDFNPDRADSVFGEGGFSVNNLNSIFGGGDETERKGAIPVNKYLWQASLDTLSFLPLASTDPFTGVIATDWGTTPEAAGERFKVTAYLLNTELSASSLKVAVFRERMSEAGAWIPAEVNPDTARRLEDAILTRARQLRLAADGTPTSG
ncbi:DUF3576 domain-containing protein [Limibaculum sp. FT325]|uniref:DUF3576 domain-containing protein n=1 Tax=Thermohalobaculum sediminis TaxID=2939436 RepID=UPI0020C0BD4C|nr:DUF3576 domain-containing protein [Limibaculum sediminis]MCL5776661.1 DUF3576 domain-containing protein [Limibaculum sediminis]